MEFFLEVLFEFFIEFFLQILIELGFTYKVKNRFNPWAFYFTSSIAGVFFGFISIFVFKNLFITNPTIKILNLFFTPVFAGILIVLINTYTNDKILKFTKIEVFIRGFLFAFFMTLVRYISLN